MPRPRLAALIPLCAALAAAAPIQAAEDTADTATALPAGVYRLDPSHASLVFQVSHIGFSNYTMSFDRFDATLTLDPAQPEKAVVTASIDPRSLDLPSPPEGFLQSLLGEQWLNAKAYPEIRFTSSSVHMTGGKTADIHGKLTLLGITRPVTLRASFNGGYTGHPMDPHARIGFSATGAFKRSDFGLTYGLPAPGTTMGVGDTIHLTLETEFSGPAMAKD